MISQNNRFRTLYEFGPFIFDEEDASLLCDGQAIAIERKAALVLGVLLRNAGQVVSHEALHREVWPKVTVEPSNLQVQLTGVRRALERGMNTRGIENVRGVGYRFVLPVIVRRVDYRGPEPALPLGQAAPTVSATDLRILRVAVIGVLLVAVLAVASGVFGRARPLTVSQLTVLSREGDHPDTSSAVMADNDRVYYRTHGGAALAFIPVGGGQLGSVSSVAADFWVTDRHPTRFEFLALRDGEPDPVGAELWVVSGGSAPPRRVGRVMANDASWSSDGRRILYSYNRKLFMIAEDGAPIRELPTPGNGSVEGPRMSPDGKRVRFSVQSVRPRSDPESVLWEVSSNGEGLRELLPGWHPQACCGVWNRAGDVYVFETTREKRTDLFALRESSGPWQSARQPERLTGGPISLHRPTFGRDDDLLFALGTNHEAEVVRLDARERVFVRYLSGISGTWLSFSPDRQWLAYVGYPDDKLWRARSDGSARQELLPASFEVDGCTWSPTGDTLAFRSRIGGQHKRIYLMPAVGGNPRPLIADDREQGMPSWSPDGKHLVFGDVWPKFNAPAGDELLHLYDVERREFSTVPGSANLWSARWSPDGRSISALTLKGSQLRIYHVERRTWRTLPALHINNPTWSSDSRYIYYDTEGDPQVWLRRARVSDGTVEDLADLKDVHRSSYSWSALTPGDEPLLLRSVGRPTIYTLRLQR